MKRLTLLAIAAIIASALLHATAQSAPADTLRLMSYNIRNCIGMDNRTDFVRVARVIDRARPDIVAVQEVDSMTRRSAHRYILGELAARTGMQPHFAPAIEYDGGRYGIGLLTRTEPSRTYAIPLPGAEEARTLFVAEFDNFVFACTHLSLSEPDRIASITIIDSIAAHYPDRPFFIAGDFNSEPADQVMTRFTRHFDIITDTTRHTHPADTPTVTIDYLATHRDHADFEILSTAVVDEPAASDHRPITATILLP